MCYDSIIYYFFCQMLVVVLCSSRMVEQARPILAQALAEGHYDELADPRLGGNYDPMEMARMVACAAAGVRHSARRRPKMSQVRSPNSSKILCCIK